MGAIAARTRASSHRELLGGYCSPDRRLPLCARPADATSINTICTNVPYPGT